MPLDQLLAALEREAREEADRLLAEARVDAARIEDATSHDLARERAAALDVLEHDLEAELEAELSVARLAGRREVLRARERLLERLFALLHERVATLPDDPRYLAGLGAQVRAALACFEPGTTLVLRATPALVDRLVADARVPATVTVEPDPSVGTGFRVVTTDGTIEVIDTLEARLGARRATLARRALGTLELLS